MSSEGEGGRGKETGKKKKKRLSRLTPDRLSPTFFSTKEGGGGKRKKDFERDQGGGIVVPLTNSDLLLAQTPGQTKEREKR